ncbi:uncharacterized protein MISP3 [Lithobates pipiens]
MAAERKNTSGCAIPENEHKGEPQTHATISELAAEGQGPEWGTVGAALGKAGQETTSQGQESQEKSREEEENERADRELSETIEQLDSVLLEAGEKEVQIEGDGTDVNRTGEASAAIEKAAESEGTETPVQVPGGETLVQVPGGETLVQVPGGETLVQVPGAETLVQVPGEETLVQVPGGETQVPGGETLVQVPGGETQVPGGEIIVQVPGEETQVPGGETTVQVSGGETTVQVSGGETTVQVSGGETLVRVPGGETSVQVSGGETTTQVSGEETTVQIPAEETTVQVSEGEPAVQVPSAEGTAQVPEEETAVYVPVMTTTVKEAERESVGETSLQVSEETSQVTNKSGSQELGLQVTTEEDVSSYPAEGTGTGMYESVSTPVTKADEAWIDTLVKNIVTEVTAQDTNAGEAPTDDQAPVFKECTDSSSEMTEEGGHSCAGRTTIPDREQVTLEETGAAVPGTGVQAQVSYDITVQEVCEGGEVTQTGRQQVGLEGVTASLTEQETADEVEAAIEVKASGEEAHGEVTPDLVTVPSREGTADPGHPAACREKEWPPLICTGSEVRADTAEQRDTQQGTVSEKEPCPGAPAMKDREMVEDGVTLTPETPIEREIRLTMEREMTLRQERGISMHIGESELVEVRRKTMVMEPVALPGKERQLAGAQMQREIQLETQREQDLVEQGKVMGTYDRGPQQELQERKMIFESMNTESSDVPLRRWQSEIQKSDSIEVLVEVPAPSNHVFSAAPAAEVKKGPSYAEANGSNIIIIEHASILQRPTPSNGYNAAPADLRRTSPAESRRSTPADLRFTRPSSGNSPVPNSESPVVAPGSPFQLLRSPSPRSLLEKEIEEVREREKELRRQRTSIYGKDNGTEENLQITSDDRSDIQSGVYQPERPNWGKLEVNWPPNKSMTINGQQDQALDSPRTRRQRSSLIQSWESGNPNPADDN